MLSFREKYINFKKKIKYSKKNQIYKKWMYFFVLSN